MHLMPETTDTSSIENPVHPTFGTPRAPARKPRLDDALAGAVDVARAAVEEFADVTEIGDHLGAVADDERVVTHRFIAHVPGYRGWAFYVTLTRAPRSKVITISETGMLPGDDALLAPKWVPWMDRASEEERIRLDAIAAGEDPVKALEAAGYGPPKQPEPEAPQTPEPESEEQKKQARRDAKRRRALAARKRKQKSGRKDSSAKKS